MRGDGRKRQNEDNSDEDEDDGRDRGRRREQDRSRDQRAFGWSKRRVPISKSGRAIKGRGNFVSISISLCRIVPYNKMNLSCIIVLALPHPISLPIKIAQFDPDSLEDCSETYD